MRNAGVVELQVGIKLAGRNINNLGFTDDTTLVSGSEEELKSLLVSERGEWKSWLEIQHSKTKIVAFGPITSWQIEGETVETVTDFILGGAPKSLQMVTAAMKLKNACSLEEKLWPT